MKGSVCAAMPATLAWDELRRCGGVQKLGAKTVTSALHGAVRDDARTRQEFPGPDDEDIR